MTWSPFGLQILFSNFKLWKILVVSVSVKPIRVCPFFHCISPFGHKDRTLWGCHQPPGLTFCILGSCKCCWITSSRVYQHFLCNRLLLQKAAENIFFICVPCASEVKTWEYTFDPVLLCNLNLFHHLTLLTYYHKNGFNLQRYTTVWIWIYRNDMVCLSTVMNS